MSLDYPDRNVWLAKRCTSRRALKTRGNLIFAGGSANRRMTDEGAVFYVRDERVERVRRRV